MSAKLLAISASVFLVLALSNFSAKAQPVAQFTGSPLAGCAPLLVQFQDQSTGGPTEWNWDLGNGTFPVIQNPSTTYFTPGTYTVKLTVKNTTGQSSIPEIKTAYITVYAQPVVAFTGTPLTGCFPQTVNFTDNSTPGSGTITSWLWDFGDGTSSTAQNPPHTYTTAGPYNVTLIVTNSFGCTKSLTKNSYVIISSGVNAAFTHSAPSGCSLPETITFQNQSTGSGTLTYQWNYGDVGTATGFSPPHTYTAAGSYIVRLIVTNSAGCTDTAYSSVPIIIGNARADFTVPSPVCTGSPVTFTNTSLPAPVSVLWTFHDGTTSTASNATFTYAAAGTYSVKLVSNFGSCKDSITKNITVVARPTAAFTGTPLSSCRAPLTVTFTNNSTGGVSSQWKFGDGGTSTATNPPPYTYNAAGTYTVTLITTNAAGCTDSSSLIVNIIPPVLSITGIPDSGCAPLIHTFSATVSGSDPIATYLWNFGDGATSTATNPSHTFPIGVYTISLTVTTVGGCTVTDTVPRGIISSSKPKALFMAAPRDVCAKDPVVFQDQSTGTVTGWLWLFGDGATSTAQNPSHIYDDTGFFTIRLIVYSSGCPDTLTLINYVHIKAPIARFNVPVNCGTPFTKIFTDQSLGPDTWQWDFGDGGTSTLQNPVHTYATVGTYTVILRVFNFATGCDHTTNKDVIVSNEEALFTASLTELCKGSSTVFTATSINNPSGIKQYEWDFGDGSPLGAGNNISHTYIATGSYTVRLTITDLNNCKRTLIKNNYINVYGPTANFTAGAPGTCLNTNITFNNTTVTDGIHPITQWHWYYGDGTDEILTAPPFQHAYATPGIYSVSVRVTDSYGCTDSINKADLVIISSPKADFSSPDTVSCPGKNIQFNNLSTGSGLTYSWNFGDGGTAAISSPIHVYAADGLYTVTLTVTDSFGCVHTLPKPQYIKIATPIADFTPSATSGTCPPLQVTFTNTSQNIATYEWDFGDGTITTTQLNPFHIYNSAGTFTAKLTIISPGGCISVKTQQIVVQGPSGTFTYAPLSGCTPLNVNFSANTLSAVSFLWDFNDGSTLDTTGANVSHSYAIPGVYLPKMILRNNAGCTVPILGIDTIKVKGVLAAFTADTLIRCTNGSVSFTDQSAGNEAITGYLWDFGDGSTSTLASPVHFYAGPGAYTVTLTVTSQSGCTNKATSPVQVRVVKTPDISLTQSPNGCTPLVANFSGNLLNGDTSAIVWQWHFSDGRQFTGQNLPPLTFINPDSSTLTFRDTLFAINSSGCKDTSFSSFQVYGKPIVVASPDITICQGAGQTISAAGAVSYTWSPAAGLSCTNCPAPVATPSSLTSYTVTGTSLQGCVNTDTVKADVRLPFTLVPGPGDTLCRGQSAPLTVSGALSYVWSPSAGLNIATGPSVIASPDTTTTYMVVGYDDKNCFTDTAYYTVKVYPIPTVSAGPDKTINVGQTITLTPTGISPDVTSVVWTPATGVVSSTYPSITVKPTQDMEYKVTVTNAGNCTTSDLVNIFVLCNGANVFIPNTFSPNGDGANDVFFPRGTGLFTIKSARIFNRWGEEVFSKSSFNANDASVGWDGTFKGQKMPGDVYVYVIEILCDNNTSLLYKGNIALIR